MLLNFATLPGYIKVGMMAMKGGLTNTLGKQTQARHAEVPHANCYPPHHPSEPSVEDFWANFFFHVKLHPGKIG